MNNIMRNSDFKNQMLYAGAAGLAAGALGLLGGYTLSWIVPNVSKVGHALTLGLTFPAASLTHELLKTTTKTGEIQKIILSSLVGYLSSYTVANLLGFSVRLLAPFMGLTALALVVIAIVCVTIPILLLFGVSVSALNVFSYIN